MESRRDFRIVLREARARYTQRALADILDVDPRTISRWEHGKSSPSRLVTHALGQILGHSADHTQQQGDFAFVDLFAGIGGIRLGFEAAGGRCVFTSEWNAMAQRTYQSNFSDEHSIAGDITKINTSEIPDHDVLLAGFPCQPFSISGVSKRNALGLAHGFEHETQGTLFFDVARVIAAKRPPAFLLENVKNLVSHDGGKTFRVIRGVLEDQLGYHVFYKVLDGRHFVPQHRERILIAGFRETTEFSWSELELPLIQPTLKSVLHPEDGSELPEGAYTTEPLGKVADKYTLSPRLWNYLQTYAEKHRAKGNGFGFGLFGPEDVARTLSARYYKDGSEILIRQDNRNPRRLTPRECARLMGFADSFKIPVSDTQAYHQFGNSVVVPLMAAAARLMRPHILTAKEPRVSVGVREIVQPRLL